MKQSETCWKKKEMTVKEIIKKTIERLGEEQVNLHSHASVEMLAERIALEIAGKFYCVPYSSQKTLKNDLF